LEHMRIAQWDILQFVRNPNHVSPSYPEGFRPRPDDQVDRKQWARSVKSFRTDLKALAAIAADPHTDLFAPIPHAPDYTILRELLLVADHNAYHIGELALLRQILDAWPPERPYLTGTPD
ncbi:MAG: DinB family protein, partial [Chitinivibrionales bacterium]|nr:DinB family protein [Chitinivibrionales bacterium]